MPSMGFRLRLALFFVATLVTVQLLTAGLVYEVTRRALVAEGERQLTANAQAFVAQMDDISARIAGNVEVLSLDYALRAAIAERDRGTVLSVLRNHGRRVGASRMLLVGLDGTVEADTGDTATALTHFPFPDLIDSAYERRTAAVVALDGKASWMVAVPIYAPQPVGLVVVSVPLDDALLAHMQQLSALPRDVELAAQSAPGHWAVVARGDSRTGLVDSLVAAHQGLPWKPLLTEVDGKEYMVLAQRLKQPKQGTSVVAVLGYSLDDALSPFRSVAIAWATLLALGLGVGLLGAWFTARSVSRPVEALAAAARRIEAGDYRTPASMQRHDEIGQLAGAFGTMTKAVHQREWHIRHQAMHDSVTDLPNRVAAEASIDQDLGDGDRTGEGALLMVGLTRLPEIIKTMGHALCDRLMRDASERMRRVAVDAYLARTSDTQFVLWLSQADQAAAVAAALRILDVLNEPYQETDVSIDRLPSVGIAMAPADGSQASTLLRHAEVAQFAASGSASGLSFYDATTDPHRPDRLSLMGDLRDALDRESLLLHYQPKLNLASQRVDGAEALLRWNHSRRGWIAPDAFIGMAEDTGNIQRVTRWVLASALAQAQKWIERGLPLHIAVNLSTRDLEDAELPARIDGLLSIHRVPAACLTVEVTERAVIGEPDTAIRILRRLAEQGVGIAIDDFGVGQSTFAYLRHLPVSELKIDQMFVKHLASDTNDRTIVRSIVDLSHRLGYRVTAEGVEDQGALDYLASIGCDHAQGYFISRALPADAFAAFATGRDGHAFAGGVQQ
ncbi:EAL domain-containing protein [Rhodanobacter sp. OK091]|uniref:putative bifunctional diguanylate cyclase/phosphodiesterase n=1 Tax=Rhodanobacter sp. OK091 TaxID=1881037 RepID=UPI00091154CB|nr:EAL domain-containing protein [Rhodanobacter sp. OK091]SHM17783.1 diguanylate cyclase/phosphodiesterase [Rhodanobacter sp. OK091]